MRQLLTQYELSHADAELLANSLEQTRKTIQHLQRSKPIQNLPQINRQETLRVKHQLKIRWVEVKKIQLSPHLVRIAEYQKI